MNTIANLKTLNLQSSEGPVAAIVIGLNIPDVQAADSFVQEVAEKFKVQRMCSPPTTSVLLITVVTEMPALVEQETAAIVAFRRTQNGFVREAYEGLDGARRRSTAWRNRH